MEIILPLQHIIKMDDMRENKDSFAALPKTGWFSDSRDSWAIANELHDSRINNREDIEL